MLLLSLVVVPVLLCLVYRLLPSYTVGPWVIFKFAGDLFQIPVIVFWLVWTLALRSRSINTMARGRKMILVTVGAFVSIVVGLGLAVLGVNLFIGLTAVFGVMNYQVS